MTTHHERERSRIEVSKGADDLPDALDPGAAFKIVGNATRLEILDTLWGTRESEPMGFAALRKAVGVRDGSKFNYHLRKLLKGGFIEKIDGKYGIRHAGVEVVCAVRSGHFTEHPTIEPFETTGQCSRCDGPLRAWYADEMFFVDCPACDHLLSIGMFPPNALVGRTPEEALLAYEQVTRTMSDLAVAGICPKCNGVMDRTVTSDWSAVPVRSPYLDTGSSALGSWHVCRHCGVWVFVTPGEYVVDHPAVVALYRDHGVDVRTKPRWELPWAVDDSLNELVSTDPFRVRVTVALEGDELVLTLDDELEVIDVEGPPSS